MTIRDQLNVTTREMEGLLADIIRKGGTPSEDQDARLATLTREFTDLQQQLEVVDPSDQLFKAINRQQMADAKNFLKKLGNHSDVPPEFRSKAGGGENLAALTFSTEQLADLQKGALNRRVTTKAAISSSTADMASVGHYNMNPFPWLRDKGRILDLLPQERTNAPAVHYFQGTTAASAAAAVAEGTAKPESAPVWSEVTAYVRKLAHYTRVNDEVLADFDTFRQVIGTEMLAGLIDEENAQLITGPGVAPNLLGLATGPAVLTVGSAGTHLDAIAAAFSTLRTGAAHCEADVVVMHPNDWYSAGFPRQDHHRGVPGRLTVRGTQAHVVGVPVVLSEHMTENTALVANLKMAATAYIRQPPVVEVAPYGGGTTEFIANQTLVRAEERLALAIHHPAAICLVTAV